MSFFTRKRKRQRPSSTSGDEMCTSWYSTDPKDLPPGFTVGSMTVPYPPPYYQKQSKLTSTSRKGKKKKERKSKSKKSVAAAKSSERKFFRDISRLQKSRSVTPLREDTNWKDDEPYPSPLEPLHPIVPDNACPPTAKPGDDTPECVGAGNVVVDTNEGEVKEEEEERNNAAQSSPRVDEIQPIIEADLGVERQPTLETAESDSESPEEQRRESLQRSCSMNALDDLKTTQPLPKRRIKSSNEDEVGTKPRGVSLDDAPNDLPVKSERPFLIHQPRSYQVVSRYSASQNRNLAALGCSPDVVKKHASISKKSLYKPKNVEVLIECIRVGLDVNTLDEATGNAPIHALVTRKKQNHRAEQLLALLIYGNVQIDLLNRRKMTALHLAIEEGDEMCIRALLAFGANVNVVGRNNFSPLDLAMNKESIPDIEVALIRIGAMTSSQIMRYEDVSNGVPKKVPRLYSFAENMKPPPISDRSVRASADLQSEVANQQSVMKMYRDLEVALNQKFSLSASYTDSDESPEDAYAMVVQQREINRFNKTLQKSGFGVFSGVEGGSRILFLDGGGIKGLVQLEVLMQLEEKTGRKITDLFDWIVGTSTGGVIALTLVYGKKSLREIFQLYFMMKDRIFSKSKIGFGFNTEVLEEILQEYLDPDINMTDVTHPKVLISAVSKATTNLELHFFNNCFGDEYMNFPVWKVARYTSATPMFFSECDNYIDGGVICNNPTEYGLTTIQNFFRQQGKKLPIALVVSIGTGVYPAVELGSIDLFLGIQTLTRIKQTAQNLISLLGNALVESEMVATNSQSRCREQGIPFYRFSPKLKDVIAGSETDNEKLYNMVIQTRIDTREQGMEQLIEDFHKIARASTHLAPRYEEQGEEEEAKDVGPSKDRRTKREDKQTKKKAEREEQRNANVSHRPNRLLDPYMRTYSGQPALSDIEESWSEVNGSKSPVHRHASSPCLRPKFHLGNEAEEDNKSRMPFGCKEEAGGQGRQPTTTSPSRSTAVGSSREGGDVDTLSDQPVSARRSLAADKVPRDDPEVARSQESSVFSTESTSSSSELQASSHKDEVDDDSGDYTRFEVFLCDDSGEQSSLKESDGNDEREEDFHNTVEPPKSATPQSTKEPEEQSEEASPSRATPSPPLHQEFASQETLQAEESVDNAVCVEGGSSLPEKECTSCDDVVAQKEGKEVGEVEERQVSSDQNQPDGDESEGATPSATLNGSYVVGEPTPEGSAHSLPVSPESPLVSGPHKNKIPRIEHVETIAVNGHTSVNEDSVPASSKPTTQEVPPITPETPPSTTETPPITPETPPITNGLVSGHEASTHLHKLQTATPRPQQEVPHHYKLNTKYSSPTQESANQNSNFPYKYETEI